MNNVYLTDDELAELRGRFDDMEAVASRWAAAGGPTADVGQELTEVVQQLRQMIDRAEAAYNGEA